MTSFVIRQPGSSNNSESMFLCSFLEKRKGPKKSWFSLSFWQTGGRELSKDQRENPFQDTLSSSFKQPKKKLSNLWTIFLKSNSRFVCSVELTAVGAKPCKNGPFLTSVWWMSGLVFWPFLQTMRKPSDMREISSSCCPCGHLFYRRLKSVKIPLMNISHLSQIAECICLKLQHVFVSNCKTMREPSSDIRFPPAARVAIFSIAGWHLSKSHLWISLPIAPMPIYQI